MKGGITSGVVYPLALVEISREFRFKNIGGTSAGAIAAALTAAAEYRRVDGGSTEGFDRLAELPKFLGSSTNGQSNLLNLFPPTKSTRRLFDVATAFAGEDSRSRKCLRVVTAVLWVSPVISLLCFLPMIAVAVLWGQGLFTNRYSMPVGVAGLLVTLVFGLLVSGIATAVLGLFVTLPRNAFGFSTGCKPSDRTLPGVTEWLFEELQQTAGRSSNDPPLTFGDVWAAGVAFTSQDERLLFLKDRLGGAALRSINLQMISTALSHGHPYRLPFENRVFAFQEDEFRRYFPSVVVDHLISAARAQAARGEEEKNDQLVHESDAAPEKPDRQYPLPPAWDLPLVVAARLSLSFPILFSMVPLHAVDYSTTGHPRKRCWFIDGGLSSNFPISLFDSPFPRWPTFGIDLTNEHPEHGINDQDPKTWVWMVNREGAGLSEHWLPLGNNDRSIGRYVGALLDTIRNWHDNMQMAVPGFRDRIVHVKLRNGEGGLNLEMNDRKVDSLAARGREAGKQLRTRFGDDGPAQKLNWNTHRWVRFKSAVSLLRERLERVQAGFTYQEPTSAYPNYPALIERDADMNPTTGEWWKAAQNKQSFEEATNALLQAASNLVALPTEPFEQEAPRPVPEMRITPRV